MDAAHKLIKAAGLLSVAALLMASPGWAQILNAPSSVLLTNTSGQDVTVTSSTSPVTEITYTIGAPTYANDNAGASQNWLKVAGGATTATTPSSLSFNLFQTSGLVQGTHTATVVLTPTAPKSLAAVTITVTYTSGVSGGGGSGTLTANVNPINLSAAVGGQNSALVSISTSSAAAISISLATATTSGGSGWLTATFNGSTSVISATTSTSILVQTNAFSLAAGTYQGTVTVTPSTGTPLTIPVNFSVGGSGVGNGTWTVTPSSVALAFTTNSGIFGSTPVTVTTTTTNTTFNASATSSNGWLLVNGATVANAVPVGNSIALSVSTQANSLTTGTYQGVVTITDTTGSAQAAVNVQLTVNGGGNGGGNGNGSTAVAPTSLTFAYQFGSALSVPQQKIVITGPAGGWSAAITTSNSGNWLQLNQTSGNSLPDPAFPPIAFIVPNGLAVGTYTGIIAITTGGGTQNVSVTLNVTQAAVLVPSPGNLTFAAQTGTQNPQPQQVFFSGSDSTVGTLSITATSNNTWITVSATPSSMTVSVDPTGLASGVYSGSITIVQGNVGNSPYNYPVVLVVNGGGSGSAGPLIFTPGSLTFNSNNGVTTPSSATLTVGANVATNFAYSTSVTGGVANWISISPLTNGSGTTTTNLTVSVNPAGLNPNTYTGAISFSSNGIAQTVPVTLTVGNGGSGGNVTVSPTSLTFSGQFGATSLTAQAITVSSASGAAGVTFTVTPTTTAGGTWLSTSVTGSTSTPSTINVTANPSGLSAGTYTGNLAIQPTGGTLVNVPITLTITALPAVSATPALLTFNYRAGDSAPAAQTIAVAGAGLTFSATAVSTGNWLVVSPASGTAPGAVSVTINPAGLTAGTYSGTVTIAGTGGAAGTTTVSVSLTVTVPLPTITKVTNAGSYATGTISPGEIITLFATDPTHPIGPTTPAGLTLDSTGKSVATTLGGVQVLIGGFAAPMVFASATQVSAVVPYEVAQLTGSTVNVLVKFLGQTSNGVGVNVVTTAPGLFTANSSGTGPGAILNADNSVNAPNNQAARGSTVVVYLTGEGQTSPAGVTGKVTTVSATPPLTPGPLLRVSILVGGQPANFSFAGEAPGFVSGAMQLNVQIPTNIGPGDQEILVTIGDNQSQRGVTVSVK